MSQIAHKPIKQHVTIFRPAALELATALRDDEAEIGTFVFNVG